MEYEDRVRIATPEGVELDLALAGVGSRLAARILDALIQIALWLGIAFALDATSGGGGGGDSTSVAGIILAIVVTFGIFWAYDVLFETFNSGRTPGKMALGLRVVGEMGEPESFSMSAVRNLLRIVDEYVTAFLVGPVAIIGSARNQRVGDMAAGTLVVKERSSDAGARTLTASPEAMPMFAAAEGWDLTAVTGEEVAAIRRFLERRGAIGRAPRSEIARELALRLRPKVPNSYEVGADELFLELVAAVKSQR